MTRNTVLIDMNSIGNAAHNSPRLTVGDIETQAVFGVVRTLRGILETYPDWRIWCLWDGSRQESWRKIVLPEYKLNRDTVDPKEQAKKDAYRKQVGILRQTLPYLGMRQLLVTSAEADDCAGYLTGQIVSNGGSVVLITGDQDWLQLVQPNVLWIDPIREKRIGNGDFFEKTGYFSAREFLQGKALQGDNSDNIPGVGGIGEKGAIELLAKYRSVEAFLAQHAADPKSIKGKKLNDFANNVTGGRDKFERNMKLMNLIDAVKPPPADVNITHGKFNPESFRKIAERLAFRSFLADMPKFIAPFQRNFDALNK
jgi:5'-3' exonuclease